MDTNKQNLLIIEKCQFGYGTDVTKWCWSLKDEYNVIVITFDEGRPKINIPQVKVIYATYKKNKILNGLAYFYILIKYLLGYKGKILVMWFKNCGLLKKIFPGKRMHLDIRSVDVVVDEKLRKKNNAQLVKDSKIFDSVSAISQGVADFVDRDDAFIIPLGADIIPLSPKQFSNNIRMLYIGTFVNRHIEQTILGLRLFIDKYPNIDIHYDIVGDGAPGQLKELKLYADTLNIGKNITFHGYVLHSQLELFLERCNVGVSYVPITDYYQNQPPTKTFEYVLSGMFCIATETNANSELINKINGVLIKDTPDSFCEGLEVYLREYKNLDSDKIKSTLSDYTWDKIVTNYLFPVIKQI